MSNPNYSLNFIVEFIPSLQNVPETVLDSLTRKFESTLQKHVILRGVILLTSTSREVPDIYAKQIGDYGIIKEIGQSLNRLDLEYLLRNLGGLGYHGSKIVYENNFAVGFLKLNETDILTVILSPQKQVLDSDFGELVVRIVKKDLFERVNQKITSMPNPRSKSDSKNDHVSSEDIPQPHRD